MRVGFLTNLLWDRYGHFWVTLAQAAGAEVELPAADAVLARLNDPRVAAAPAVAFRLAIAAALSLDTVDVLVVPRLNPEDGAVRGAGQDPWVADLPTMLARSVPGLPALWPVEADLERPVESNAIGFLRRLAPDAALVRRAWSQHRAEARPPRRGAATAASRPDDTVVAVVGQPWVVTPALAELARREGERVVGPYQLDPARLRAEGRRGEPALADTDAEALGAVRRFARTAGVPVLRMVVDGQAGCDAWLARRARAIALRRLHVVELRTLAEPDRLFAALLGLQRGVP